ncbi:MAG TPA: type II secretion system inner membrane protein GspF [Burkholderiaceae bacterium]|nr:type II secretion system inner membrane protein GspF [Burkholderiaceae bacterium]
MPAYTFEAVDAQGNTKKGVLEGDSARAVRGLLRNQSLIPISVEPIVGSDTGGANGKGLNRVLFSSRIYNSTNLAIWTRQVAGLVTSGLPLERALTALTDECEDERQRNLLANLRAEVNAGSTFAKALAQHPKEFSDIYTAVIAAGEQSGNLGLVLERLADDLEEQQALKSKLMGAALYPAIVTVVAIIIVLFLVGYVVPQVANVFIGTKKALPFLTVAMLATSDFVRNYGWWLLAVFILIALAVYFALKNPVYREKFDAAFLNFPIIGKLARGYNAARFASTLAMLASAGVPILKSLQAAAQTLSNTAMRADAMDALVLVREGAPLASALAQKKRFPGIVSMFARLGEQTGQMPLMLSRAAKQLSIEVQRRAMHLATILEPLLIVAMGVVVLLIVMAVLLPIIQLNQMVR